MRNGKFWCLGKDSVEIVQDIFNLKKSTPLHMDRVKRIWYLSPMRAAKVQASLRIRAVSPEPSLLAHTSSESRGTFRQKTRSLALLNGWACAVKICHDGMLEDTNSLDAAHKKIIWRVRSYSTLHWSTKIISVWCNLIQIILKKNINYLQFSIKQFMNYRNTNKLTLNG